MALFDSLGKRVRNFDAFAKTMDDFKVRTKSGGVVSIVGYVIMSALFLSELKMYLSNRVETKLVVDNSRGEGMSIYLDIHFPKISCNLLGIDALDSKFFPSNKYSDENRKAFRAFQLPRYWMTCTGVTPQRYYHPLQNRNSTGGRQFARRQWKLCLNFASIRANSNSYLAVIHS